jgi:hypothetical protein
MGAIMWCRWLLVTLFLTLPIQAWAGERIALVVGINRYNVQSNLVNTHQDVQYIVEAFEANGIKVINKDTLYDLTFVQLENAFRQLVDQAVTADEVYVYFAGHGLQHNNSTYLLASDTPLYTGEMPQSASLLDSWLNLLQSANPNAQRVFFIDACRDNPLNQINYVTPSFMGIVKRDQGTVVVYSTARGQTVKDNNPFAKELANYFKLSPYSSVSEIIDATTIAVNYLTKKTQLIDRQGGLGRKICPLRCLAQTPKPPITIPASCIDDACLATPLTVDSFPISTNEFKALFNANPRPMDSDNNKGCMVYENNAWKIKYDLNWYTPNLNYPNVAHCLSANDIQALANWYTSTLNRGYYRLPNAQEQYKIAAYFKRKVAKEQLEQCEKMDDNVTCYGDPQFGVYLVRE